MIKHHEGALIMVEELFSTPGAGQESEIFAFASDVDADQRMEIDRMRGHAEGASEMRVVATSVLCCSAVLLCFGLEGRGQEAAKDPRVGLKPGLRDAGQAARNMELVSSLPKPEGFFDPKAPGGDPTEPERTTPAGSTDDATPAADQPAGSPQGSQRSANALSFANSDLAFSGSLVFIGNFHGFNSYDIETAKKPQLFASVVCPGGQGDLSVHGNLLFMSVEQTRARIDCGTQGVTETVSTERFRGIRIFDISDVKRPKQIAAVQTCRGSHTHTLVTDPKDPANLYIYGSGTGTPRAGRSSRDAPQAIPRTTPTPRSSASTSSRCRSPRRKQRASSTGRAFLRIRRPAPSRGSGRGAITGPGRRKRR